MCNKEQLCLKLEDADGKILHSVQRGGTAGFRAPEVLLMSTFQDTSLDM